MLRGNPVLLNYLAFSLSSYQLRHVSHAKLEAGLL